MKANLSRRQFLALKPGNTLEPGPYKRGGSFHMGRTGAIRRHDFKLLDARFGGRLRTEAADFRLIANQDTDFVIFVAFLPAGAKPRPAN